MSLGKIKFFELSSCLAADGASLVASTGSGSATNCLDKNPVTYWRSVGSSDVTSETLEITLSASTTIDRIFVVDHNWKDFTIKYDHSGSWTHFASVTGLDGSKSNITETAFADDTAYYEFTPVTTTKILVTVTKTQTANQEKYVAQIMTTSELGMFAGYPNIKKIEMDRNNRMTTSLSGKVVVMKSIETAAFQIDFKDYPRLSTYSVDFDLVMTLHDRETAFLVWLCGGRRGTGYFGYTLRGFRLKDIYVMQVTKKLDLNYSKNGYMNQLNTAIMLEEHI